MASGSAFRGPVLYQTSGINAGAGVGNFYPYLNGIYGDNAESQPFLVTAGPDEKPRQFGYAVMAGTKYPGPYAASSIAGSLSSNALTNGGTITQGNITGGSLIITTGAAGGNQASIFSGAAAGTLSTPYAVVAGKRIWFSTRLAITTVASGVLQLGLGSSDPADITTFPTDGIFFSKTGAGTDFIFQVRKAGTSTSVTNVCALAGQPLVAATQIELGFLVDFGGLGVGAVSTAQGAISCYVNGRLAGSVTSSDANIPTANLGMVLAAQAAGAAVAIVNVTQFLCLEEI